MQHTKEVLIGVGLAVSIAVITGSVLGASSISQAQTELLDIETANLKKGSSGDALLSVKIKNAGNSPLDSVHGQLNFDVDGTTTGIQPFTFVFTPTTLEPGATTAYVGQVTDSAGMSMGESYTLSVNGTTQQGTLIQDTGVAAVSRF